MPSKDSWTLPMETEADASLPAKQPWDHSVAEQRPHTCTRGLPQSCFLGGGRGHAAAVCQALLGSCAHRTLVSPHWTEPQGAASGTPQTPVTCPSHHVLPMRASLRAVWSQCSVLCDTREAPGLCCGCAGSRDSRALAMAQLPSLSASAAFPFRDDPQPQGC